MVRLSPDERRAALVAATLPLLRTDGLEVSTRKIAQAAGVAEGTIFRVFPDKAALISAAITHAFDPTPVIATLASMRPELDLRLRLLLAAEVIRRRMDENFPLLLALGTHGCAHDAHNSVERIVAAVAELIAPDRSRLRQEPQAVAWLLTSMLMMQRGRRLAANELVSVLLDGVLSPERTTAPACS